MNIALRELRRRPGRFTMVGAALTMVVTLLVLLGGLLDGLIIGTTGALHAQQADLVVFSADARESVQRSRLTVEDRAVIEGVDGVLAVGGLGTVLVPATVPGTTDPVSVAVFGHQLPVATEAAVPESGTAYADRSLEADGVTVGSELLLGPTRQPVTVVGWVEGTGYLGQGSLWVAPATWRRVQALSRPDQALDHGVFQVLVVEVEGDPPGVGARIDEATRGATTTLTTGDAADAIPGVRAQDQVMTGLIGVTLTVAGLVAALFFALLLIERTALYAVLKALGASSSTLAAGIVLQSVIIALAACFLGGVLSLVVAELLPAAIPLDLRPGRFLVSAALVLISATLGALVSLRRIVRIEPASALT